jgi:hypothetical protein
LLCAFFPIVLIILLGSGILAQDNARQPAEFSPSSSLSEIVDWLDKNSFAQARIGLKGRSNSSWPPWQKPHYSHLAVDYVFSPGFRLTKSDSCNLWLKNDDVKIINYKGLPMQHSVELILPLGKMSDKKGKAPYRYTENPRKAALFGTWRTVFKNKKGNLETYLDNSGEREHHYADTLMFTFDDKEAADKFNAAFRQAIRLCKAK